MTTNTLTADPNLTRKIRDDCGAGMMICSSGRLPLVALKVHSRMHGLMHETVVDQTFNNVHGEPIEATYIFPLLDRAAVTGLRMTVGDRIVEGELLERAAARQKYDEAFERGQAASILEEERPDVFMMRVGNLPSGARAVVRLTLTGPLAVDNGEATWQFPLVVAPRYITRRPIMAPACGPGTHPDTDAVPDASRITPPILMPGYPNPVQFSLEVDLWPGGLAVADPRVSLHSVVTKQTGANAFHIQATPGQKLNCDFILRFRVAADDVQTTLTVTPDATGEGGTYALTLVPQADAHAAALQPPRDLVFLLDRSGSMEGWKIVAARRALTRIVDALSPADRFTVLAFSDGIDTPPIADAGEWLEGTADSRARVAAYLASVRAVGGTEMAAPLQLAVLQLAASPPERDRVLVLITDGQVGNERQIVAMLSNQLTGIRVMTLGVDRAVNAAFLRQLAVMGGGYSELVETEARLDDVMDKVQRRLGRPQLSELAIYSKGWTLEESTQVPRRLPGLYANTPITIAGRYRGKPGQALQIRAVDAAGQAWTTEVPAIVAHEKAVTYSWAREQVRAQEDEYLSASAAHKLEMEKHIVATSLRFGVLCRFTAWLAVDIKQVVEPNGQLKRVIQPVECPSGWSNDLDTLGRPPGMMKFVDTTGGVSFKRRFGHADWGPARGSPNRFSLSASFGQTSLSESVNRCEMPTVTLDAYRDRAKKLAERLAKGPSAFELAVIAVDLDALIDDLKSVGILQSELQPLRDSLAKLRNPGGDLTKLADEARTILLHFAAPEPVAREFWK